MIKKTAIIGMGALGVLYADIIASAGGDVCFVMSDERLKKGEGNACKCNGVEKTFRVESTLTIQPADLLIVAVKYPDLASAIEDMRGCVGENTIIVSVLNGISSEEIIAETYGREKLINTVAQGMDAVKIGNELTFTQRGELHIGIEGGQRKENLDAVAAYFDQVGIPYVIEEDIEHRMWGKFMLNVGVNQTCLAYETNYGGVLVEGSEPNETMTKAMREVIALANKEGVGLSEMDLLDYIDILWTLSPEGVPSMRQDGIAKRYSEVELFAGTVISMSKKYGLPTPVNEFLYKKIKEIEAAY